MGTRTSGRRRSDDAGKGSGAFRPWMANAQPLSWVGGVVDAYAHGLKVRVVDGQAVSTAMRFGVGYEVALTLYAVTGSGNPYGTSDARYTVDANAQLKFAKLVLPYVRTRKAITMLNAIITFRSTVALERNYVRVPKAVRELREKIATMVTEARDGVGARVPSVYFTKGR